eukprot:2450871-Prymnesium_polylepis.1
MLFAIASTSFKVTTLAGGAATHCTAAARCAMAAGLRLAVRGAMFVRNAGTAPFRSILPHVIGTMPTYEGARGSVEVWIAPRP